MRTPGEGSVYETKDGRWRGYVTLGLDARGKPIRKYFSAGKNKAQANAALRKKLREREAGELAAGKDLTVNAWLDWWLENIVRPKLAPKTHAGYESIVNVWLKPAFGGVRLSKLTPEHLDRLYADMVGKDSGQVRLAHAVIRRALKIAVRRGKVARNVAELVDPPVRQREEVEPLTAVAARAVLKAADGRRNGARWRVALSLGLRQGEALGLSWDDVDLDQRVIRIRSQLQRYTWRHGCGEKPCGGKRGADCPKRYGGGLALRRPKSRKSRRTIVLPATLAAALKAHRVAQTKERMQEGSDWVGFEWDGEPVPLVFAQRDGRPIDPTDDREEWLDVLEAAEVAPARLHDARHTAATLLLLQGVDVKVVAEILGHATTTLTRDTYQHVVPELQQAAADAMEAALGGSTSGSRRTRRQRVSTGAAVRRKRA